MMTCPVCQHRELEGELFCSECGARLLNTWVQPPPTDTFIDTGRIKEPARGATQVVGPVESGQIALSLNGIKQPIILAGRSEYIIGREGHEQLVPDLNLNNYGGREQGVSRVHAALRQERNQLLLVDLGSTNGTALNGTTVAAHQPTPVHDGDEIRLGRLTLRIHFTFPVK